MVNIIKIHRKLLPASKCSEIKDFWHVRNVPFQTDAGFRFFVHKNNQWKNDPYLHNMQG